MKGMLLGLIGFSILGVSLVLSATTPGQAAPAGGNKDVVVVNTPAEPIPVVGTVSLAGTPTVLVGNFPAGAAAAPTPVTLRFQVMGVSAGGTTYSAPYIVPAGKRLVVEHVTLRTFLQGGLPYAGGPIDSVASLQTTPFVDAVQSLRDGIPIPQPLLSLNDDLVMPSVSQPLRMYVNAGESLALSLWGGATLSVTLDANAIVIGYLVNVP